MYAHFDSASQAIEGRADEQTMVSSRGTPRQTVLELPLESLLDLYAGTRQEAHE